VIMHSVFALIVLLLLVGVNYFLHFEILHRLVHLVLH
jgi:hypothetical protein